MENCMAQQFRLNFNQRVVQITKSALTYIVSYRYTNENSDYYPRFNTSKSNTAGFTCIGLNTTEVYNGLCNGSKKGFSRV